MKELYNGYRFSPDSEKSVFHAAMCMEYLRVICEKKREPRGAEVFDSSVAVDLSRIHGILSLGIHSHGGRSMPERTSDSVC